MFINICQDLATSSTMPGCTAGAAACLYVGRLPGRALQPISPSRVTGLAGWHRQRGNTFLAFGGPAEPSYANGLLTMDLPPLAGSNRSTHIVFRCSTNGLVRAFASLPLRSACYLG
jgi:hypothetical protein